MMDSAYFAASMDDGLCGFLPVFTDPERAREFAGGAEVVAVEADVARMRGEDAT